MLSRPILMVVATAISWISAGCTVHFFWCFFKNRQKLLEITGPRRTQSFLNNAYFLFVWIGVGYCIFCGAEATLQWIPKRLATFSDEGDDPMWIGYDLAAIAAFFASLLLLAEMGELALKLFYAERRHDQ